jgi:hypothetical protein
MQPSRIAHYLAVPAQAVPATFIVVFALLMTLVSYAGLFGMWLGLLLFFGFIRYSFAVIEAVKVGARELPVLSVEMLNPVGEMRSIVVLALVAGMFFTTGAAAYWMPRWAGIAVGLVTLALLLHLVLMQAATGSIQRALDLRMGVQVMHRLGRDFLLLCACALLAFLLLAWLDGWRFLPMPVRMALQLYIWLAVFALIGGVLHERWDDLGFEQQEIETVELDKSAAAARQRDLLVDTIYGQWRAGAKLNAWQSVTRHLQDSADPIAELHWMHERIARWPDPGLAPRLAQEVLSRLLAARRDGEALNWISLRLRTDPDFHPRTGAESIRAIELARNAGDRPIARLLLKQFARFHPGEPLPPHLQQLRGELER